MEQKQTISDFFLPLLLIYTKYVVINFLIFQVRFQGVVPVHLCWRAAMLPALCWNQDSDSRPGPGPGAQCSTQAGSGVRPEPWHQGCLRTISSSTLIFVITWRREAGAWLAPSGKTAWWGCPSPTRRMLQREWPEGTWTLLGVTTSVAVCGRTPSRYMLPATSVLQSQLVPAGDFLAMVRALSLFPARRLSKTIILQWGG